MVVIARSEIVRMENHILDEETGMTELDYFEANNCYEDWQVIEDMEELK